MIVLLDKAIEVIDLNPAIPVAINQAARPVLVIISRSEQAMTRGINRGVQARPAVSGIYRRTVSRHRSCYVVIA